MISKEELSAALGQFTGTESYLRHKPFGGRGLVLTDGARFVAEKAGAWWLMDAILSYQPQCKRDPMLRDMQFWKLKVGEDREAVLTCERDEGDIAITQVIPATDFPLGEIKLWVELGSVDMENPDYVLMLPSER